MTSSSQPPPAPRTTRPLGFQCPLRGACFDSHPAPFASYAACNRAVAQYLESHNPAERRRLAAALYRRFLPLVRKTLHRFCHPFRRSSRCYPGACLPEELVGESYLAFRKTLDQFDPNRGIDFVGYASRRLYWHLEHRARQLQQGRNYLEISERRDHPTSAADEEERLLNRLLAQELVAKLTPSEAQLLEQHLAGHPLRELAERNGVSEVALRKRLERLRRKLKAFIERP